MPCLEVETNVLGSWPGASAPYAIPVRGMSAASNKSVFFIMFFLTQTGTNISEPDRGQQSLCLSGRSD